ncbi:hypothetical protein GU243_15160 [Pseudarthrobacter psychrotolerans]|uniref:Uncharacterized protein n=1 Tax=Pseudarthrobacter psychrotolerans TaxID=2697569 RepID=A0A6P1NP20_9MICC|nr:hypothetical protein [Pseudarthrobacter psychrotolerans]QHK20833.1 hypothetical protein GU243_15160 [Pseudarthrobacter psychrotolerans]
MDQPTQGNHRTVSRLTPVGTVQLEKFRPANKYRLVAYPTAKGCAAACFPEANALLHKENVARGSNTPGFKAMFVRFVPHAEAAAPN